MGRGARGRFGDGRLLRATPIEARLMRDYMMIAHAATIGLCRNYDKFPLCRTIIFDTQHWRLSLSYEWRPTHSADARGLFGIDGVMENGSYILPTAGPC